MNKDRLHLGLDVGSVSANTVVIDELRGSALFKGARGTKPSDIEAAVEVLLRISQLLCDLPEVQEIDINPLRVFQEKEGCLALDVRMILEKDRG